MKKEEKETNRDIIISLVKKAMRGGSSRNIEINESTDLIAGAGLDSLALMEVIENVQQECKVVFTAEDYAPERFATVADIVRLVSDRSSKEA